MPGVWEITSGQCERQVDHKKTKNKDGAHIKDMGVLPGRFSARGRMVAEADWEILQQVMPDINLRKHGAEKSPLAIFHPAIALLGINVVYVERVRVPELRNGILEIQLDLIEWSEPAATAATGKIREKAGMVYDGPDTYVQRTRDFPDGFTGAEPPPARYVNGQRVAEAKPAPDDPLIKLIDDDAAKHPNRVRAPSDAAAQIDPSEFQRGGHNSAEDFGSSGLGGFG